MAKTNFLIILTITVLLTVLGGTTIATAEIIYVDDDAPVSSVEDSNGGANDGSSWENAYSFLQDALAVAVDGDEIRVAQGIYTPDCNSAIPDGTGDREATFQLRSNISLIGGYAGFGELDPDARDIEAYRTILSGDLNGDDVDVNNPGDLDDEPTRAENSYHVVTSNSNVVLDGFIITGGNANGPRLGTNLYRNGGGMFNDGSSPTIINCTVSRNSVGNNGGGIYNDGGNPNLINCIIISNFAWSNGGGIYNEASNPSMTNCTIIGNYARSEGGGIYNEMSNPGLINWELIEISAWNNYIELYISQNKKITDCTFIENISRSGGGMFNDNSSPILIGCKFSGNVTNYRGGGIYNDNGSSPILSKCVLRGNSSAQDGGGIYHDSSFTNEGNLIIVGSIFIRNLAQNNGGGISLYRSKMYLINCTFNLNSAETGSTLACESFGSHHCVVEINNCILWDGNNGIWIEENSFEGSSIVNIYYSDIYGGWEGEGNIDEDPLFVNQLGPDHTPGTEDDDLKLVPVSPCIDTGEPDYVAGPNETDLDGNPRIVSGLLDMGAYEFQGHVYVDDDAPYEQWTGEPEIDHLEEDGSEIRPFDTIQEAIDMAKDGYTVLVRLGLYGKIDFKGKAITVAGTDGAPIIDTLYNTSPPHGRSDEELLMEDAVTFHTGEGRDSVLKNFIIRKSATAISLNFSSPKIYNVTIVENDFGIAAYENSNPDIRNCILWDNINGDLFQCEAKYSCIETGIGGEGNINVNPLFVDEANGDYHLKSEGWRWNTASQSWTWDDVTSRCIDAGDPCSPLGDEPMSVPRDPDNLYGINRRINMGAFGGTCQASMPPLNWLFPEREDYTAPVPDPAQWDWDGAPREINIGGGEFDFWVQMTAMKATDDSGPVEYFFECTTESGFNSGWQISNEYSIKISRGEQNLRFRVKARDLYGNETAWSEERTAH